MSKCSGSLGQKEEGAGSCHAPVRDNAAAIDLGTNSCRLLITDFKGHTIYRESIATKLGEGLFANKAFTPMAIERGLNAFRKFASILDEQKVRTYRAIATASCRMASNGEDFVKCVKDETNISLEIIDGYEEARLNLRGALLNVPVHYKYVIVFDIGGGSTELTFATNERLPKIISTRSIPWGGRNASEAFGLENDDAVRRKNLALEIESHVNKFIERMSLETVRNETCLIATSSTPLRLAAMAQHHGSYNRDQCDGLTLKWSELKKAADGVFCLSLDERKQSPYIGENRAPIFISSCTIFKTICEKLGFNEVTVSLKGAQEAIIFELIDNTNGNE